MLYSKCTSRLHLFLFLAQNGSQEAEEEEQRLRAAEDAEAQRAAEAARKAAEAAEQERRKAEEAPGLWKFPGQPREERGFQRGPWKV